MLMLLLPDAPGTLIELCVIFPQPVTGVEVMVGVVVTVGVLVGVKVGTRVCVLVGRGVKVTITTGTVAVEVEVGTVAVAVGVLEGAIDVNVDVGAGPDVLVANPLESSSKIPRIVRALEEVMVRELIGIKLSIGL